MRKELNEKIDGIVNSQPNFKSLFEELFTLRRDTNALLESHSALNREPQPTVQPSNQPQRKCVKQENDMSSVQGIENVEALHQLPSRVGERQAQQQEQSYNQSRDSRRTRMTTTLSLIHI